MKGLKISYHPDEMAEIKLKDSFRQNSLLQKGVVGKKCLCAKNEKCLSHQTVPSAHLSSLHWYRSHIHISHLTPPSPTERLGCLSTHNQAQSLW